MGFPVKLTDQAVDKIYNLLLREDRLDLRLRIAVSAGGCSGLTYQIYFDDAITEKDKIESFREIEVIIDEISLPYLEGSVIDYNDSLIKQGFSIENPNANGTCACGDSFH